MGDFNSSIDLIIRKIKDANYAIKFIEDQKDNTLWIDLVDKCISKENEKFLSELINPILGYIDPIVIVEKITSKPKIHIDDLKTKLEKYFYS
jgi:hypothetical protein